MLERIDKAIHHPDRIILNLGKRQLLNWVSDERYLRIVYWLVFKKKLNLDDPQTFNEKLQWLKLNDRRPEYTMMVDNCEAKKFVADKIGEEYIIPTLGVWDRFDDIDFTRLPEQFVLKCTHDSGGLVICKDRSKFDVQTAKKKIERCLKRNFYWYGREWPYKNVRPKIIAEKYMADEFGAELKDYKVFNSNGEPKLMQVNYNRFVEHKRNLYGADWEVIEATFQNQTDYRRQIDRSKRLEKMLEVARRLSAGLPYVRTDFYCIGDQLYFGELTFYREPGLGDFSPENFVRDIGKWLKLPGGGYVLISDSAVFVLRAENLAADEELKDYKFMCFNGRCRCIFTVTERFSGNGLKVTFFDRSWNPLPFERHYPKSEKPISKPYNLEKMIELAEKLSEDLPFVRVDFYESDAQIRFGELTLYPGNGLEEFTPEEWDRTLGGWLDLRSA